jgi:hypothetical protein
VLRERERESKSELSVFKVRQSPSNTFVADVIIAGPKQLQLYCLFTSLPTSCTFPSLLRRRSLPAPLLLLLHQRNHEIRRFASGARRPFAHFVVRADDALPFAQRNAQVGASHQKYGECRSENGR